MYQRKVVYEAEVGVLPSLGLHTITRTYLAVLLFSEATVYTHVVGAVAVEDGRHQKEVACDALNVPQCVVASDGHVKFVSDCRSTKKLLLTRVDHAHPSPHVCWRSALPK